MKPAAFDYLAPASLGEALALLADLGEGAKPLAGGQSLVPLMNFRLVRPQHVIDLNGLGELAGIREDDGHLVIGAMTRQRAVETSALVAERCPLLAEAMPQIGHVQIRNRGTVGGSLAHADPAAELPAVVAALGGRAGGAGHPRPAGGESRAILRGVPHHGRPARRIAGRGAAAGVARRARGPRFWRSAGATATSLWSAWP